MSETYRFDGQFWQRFLAIAQPYWYPGSSGGGKLLGLLLLLMTFLLTTCFIAVSVLILGGQYYFPEILNSIAPGLTETIANIVHSQAIYLIVLSWVAALLGFAYYSKQLQEHWRPWFLLTLLIILLLSNIGAHVLHSYLGRDLITAMAEEKPSTYFPVLLLYSAALLLVTPLTVLSNYVRKKLAFDWQQWLTNDFLAKYFHNKTYYEIKNERDVDNPDQRISKEIESFTQTSMNFSVAFVNQIINLIAYGLILWSISKPLVGILIVYAGIGNAIAIAFSRRLVALNADKLQYEANFRYSLIRVGENAESIAFSGGENKELSVVKQRFNQIAENFKRTIGWERNIEFFTNGYQEILFIIPLVVLAPLYFSDRIELGAITQASMVCSQLSAALSLIVSRFESLSALAAVVNRLGTFRETLASPKANRKSVSTIESVSGDRLSLEAIALQTPKGEKTLVKDLSVSVSPGERLLIVGASGCGKSSLLRAIAGLWDAGKGRIVRPKLEEMMFLPQRPYMILGSLREQLLYPNANRKTLDEELESVLHQVNLPDLLAKVNGFDAELDWSSVLSLGEQQRLAFARLLLNSPRYAFLDEATSALDLQNENHLYQQLQQTDITFISVGHRESLLKYHQRVLQLSSDSSWRLFPAHNFIT